MLKIIRYLPEIIDLVKWIIKQEHEIETKIRLKAINKALHENDRTKAAAKLNDIFKH